MYNGKGSSASLGMRRPLKKREIQCCFFTLEVLSKKHLDFDQGMEFLKFGQGNRGPNQQHRRKTEETIKKNEGHYRKFDKKLRDRDPYFSLKKSLLKKKGVQMTTAFGRSLAHTSYGIGALSKGVRLATTALGCPVALPSHGLTPRTDLKETGKRKKQIKQVFF